MLPRALALHITVLCFTWVASFAQATQQLGSVSFLESTPGSYLRSASSNSLKGGVFSYADVSAAMAVLLGSAPPASISDESASKLNELIVPNPFHRPHAVLLLTLQQIKAVDQVGKVVTISAQHRGLQLETRRGALILPEDGTLLLLNITSQESVSDGEMQDLASFLGGSYEVSKEPLRGILSVDLPDGDTMTLDFEKKQHRALAYKLFSIFQRIKDAAATLDKRSGGLVVGSLTVAEELYEEPDSSITLREASDLLHLAATKVFVYLDTALNGRLVGVIVHAQEQILDMSFNWGPSRLQLLQTSSDTITAAVAEVLTETIIAYITGILFIVALIIGTCFLFKMPLTKDTLLYSGAKLD